MFQQIMPNSTIQNFRTDPQKFMKYDQRIPKGKMKYLAIYQFILQQK